MTRALGVLAAIVRRLNLDRARATITTARRTRRPRGEWARRGAGGFGRRLAASVIGALPIRGQL